MEHLRHRLPKKIPRRTREQPVQSRAKPIGLNYRRIPGTDLNISCISLGTWKYRHTETDKKEWTRLFTMAIEEGVNYLDNAITYDGGNAEKFIGNLWNSVSRSRVLLGTKCYFPTGPASEDRGLSRKHVFKCAESSLKNLKTDYIDIFQCHRWDSETPIGETIDAMNALKEQGKIRYWGLGAATAAQMVHATYASALADKTKPATHQHVYNMFNRTVEFEVLDYCKQLGLGLLVYSPLSQGILSGKYNGGSVPEQSRAANALDRASMWDYQDIKLQKAEKITKLATKIGMAPATLSLAWCMRHLQVSTVITSVSTDQQWQQNISAAGLTLNEDTIQEIETILDNKPYNIYTQNP